MYTRVGSNRNNNRLAENDKVNSDPYHMVSNNSPVEEITHHRRFPNYILAKKLRKRKNTRVILTWREYLRVKIKKHTHTHIHMYFLILTQSNLSDITIIFIIITIYIYIYTHTHTHTCTHTLFNFNFKFYVRMAWWWYNGRNLSKVN